jgi:hypothetical protein
LFLTHEQLIIVTHKKSKPAQARALKAMAIEHIIRPDGSPLVLCEHVEHVLGAPDTEKEKKNYEPNWKAITG